MAQSLTLKINCDHDPLFQEFIKLAEDNDSFRAGLQFLIEEKKLFVLQPAALGEKSLSLRVTWHFTDEAMQLFYKHKGV